jgi:hypothetical protein
VNFRRKIFAETEFKEPKSIFLPRVQRWKKWLADSQHKGAIRDHFLHFIQVIGVVGHADITRHVTGSSWKIVN